MNTHELLAGVQELRRQEAEALVGGRCVDWAEYQKRVATLRAYDRVVELTRERRDESTGDRSGE